MPLHTANDEVLFNFEQRTAISAGADFQEWNMTITVDSEIPEGAPPLFIKRDLLRVYLQQEMVLPSSVFPFYSPKNCWVSELVAGRVIRLFDGGTVRGREITNQYIEDLPLDDDFNALRGFGVVQSSFSEDAYLYWKQVDQVSNRTGSIFEVPPAPIPGNLINVRDPADVALGFFEVAKVDTVGRQITLDDIPIFMPLNGDIVDCSNVSWSQLVRLPFSCFPCLDELGVDPACYQCLVLPNSVVTKPSYLN